MGIEPTFSAWEADVLPLNYTRIIQLSRLPSSVMGLLKYFLILYPFGAGVALLHRTNVHDSPIELHPRFPTDSKYFL